MANGSPDLSRYYSPSAYTNALQTGDVTAAMGTGADALALTQAAEQQFQAAVEIARERQFEIDRAAAIARSQKLDPQVVVSRFEANARALKGRLSTTEAIRVQASVLNLSEG